MKILFVVHGYPPTAVAGTEICARRLCVSLKGRGHDVFVMTREERPGYPEYKVMRDEMDGVPVVRVVNNFTRVAQRYLYEYHPRIEEIFEEILKSVRPEIVHIQHLAGTSWGIPGLVRKHGLPLVVSLHDYWYACERVQLLKPDGTICGGPEGGLNCALYCAHDAPSYMASAVCERVRMRFGMLRSAPCEKALLSMLAFAQKTVMRRKTRRLKGLYAERCERLLGNIAKADLLIAPSSKARGIYLSLGVDKDKCIVIPHGAPPFPSARGGAGIGSFDGNRPLVVGYTGTIMPHKGIVTLLRAVRGLEPSRVRLRMYGRAYPRSFANYVLRLVKRFPRGQVEIRGTYRPEEMPEILSGLDILVIPSLWHETYNLVMWEAWASGLPVVASRVGALADSIRDGIDGLTFNPGDPKELRGIIAGLADNPSSLAALRRNLPRLGIGLEENAARYEEQYRRLLR